MTGYQNPFLHGKPVRACDSQDEREIRDLGDALAERFGLGDDTVIADLLSLPKELALSVLVQMVERTIGFQHRMTELLRVKLTREAMLVGGDVPQPVSR